MRFVALALLFPALAFANCPLDLDYKKNQECRKQEAIKKEIDKSIPLDVKLNTALNNALARQKHEHLKTKLTDANKAFVDYAKLECTAESWKTLQKVLDDEGLARIDTDIEQTTINDCIDLKFKSRIKYLNSNY